MKKDNNEKWYENHIGRLEVYVDSEKGFEFHGLCWLKKTNGFQQKNVIK